MSHEIDVQDVEYVRYGATPLLARVFKPRGSGPFPLIVQLHGGAWCRGDRLNDTPMNETLARAGIVVAALDFRQPPTAPYPGSMADINYAIRWFKSRAAEFATRPELVGALGISSGSHQAILGAMRPRDPRYAALPLPPGSPAVDATLRFAVLCWPVIDPLHRYRYAKELKAAGPPYPDFVDTVLPCHDQYWQTEAAMAEGNPVLALERGERVELPSVLYVQGDKDLAHPRADLERFVALYRKAGGQLDLELAEGEGQAYVKLNAGSPAAKRGLERIIEFIGKHAV